MKELKELVENLAKKLQLQDMCLVNEIKGIFQQKHIFMVILQHLSRTSFFLPLKSPFPGGSYLFKVNNGNTRTICRIGSKLTIKTLELRH